MSNTDSTERMNGTARRDRFIQRLCLKDGGLGFADLAEELREVVPHRFFAYAVVRTSDGRIERLYNVDFPLESLRNLHLSEESECEVVRHWLREREPLLLEERLPDAGFDALQPDVVESKALAIHAQMDLTGSRAIAFCFGDVPRAHSDCVFQELRALTPYLYAFAVRAIRGSVDSRKRYLTCERLTDRETEVLRWVYHGKTNDEIAAILRISVFTVKNHVQRILLKLNAANRVQAVSRAAEAGLVGDNGHDLR